MSSIGIFANEASSNTICGFRRTAGDQGDVVFVRGSGGCKRFTGAGAIISYGIDRPGHLSDVRELVLLGITRLSTEGYVQHKVLHFSSLLRAFLCSQVTLAPSCQLSTRTFVDRGIAQSCYKWKGQDICRVVFAAPQK